MKKYWLKFPKTEKKEIKLSGGNENFQGKGCPKCGGTGMKGRIGIFEVFISMEEEVINLLGDKVEEEELAARRSKTRE